jgi:hypothetical protein
MLFSKKCGCVPPRPPDSRNGNFDRRDLLCAGGRGIYRNSRCHPYWRIQNRSGTSPWVHRATGRSLSSPNRHGQLRFFFAPKENLKRPYRSNDWGHS